MSKHVFLKRSLVLAATLWSFGLAEPFVSGLFSVSEAFAKPVAAAVDEDIPVQLQPDRLPMLGNPNAVVTVVEFVDYQCPFCSRVQTTVKELLKAYPSEIRLVAVPFPLAFHKDALPAAKAAHAAFLQGKFWEMHDALYANQNNLTEDFFISQAQALGLNVSQFKQDYYSESTEKYINKSIKDGQAAKIAGTPSFFINGELFVGAQPLDNFKTAINNSIKRADEYIAANKGKAQESALKGDALYKALTDVRRIRDGISDVQNKNR